MKQIRFVDSYVLNKRAKFGAKKFTNLCMKNCDFRVVAFFLTLPVETSGPLHV